MEEKYFIGGELNDEKIIADMKRAIVDYEDGDLVSCVSTLQNIVNAVNLWGEWGEE